MSPERFPVPPPETPPEPERRRKVTIVETSELVESEARDVGEAKLHASKAELKGVGGFFKKIWKHELFKEYYSQKEIAQARSEIVETGNLYVGELSDSVASNQAKQALTERFASEYEGMIHEGERRDTLGGSVDEQRIKDGIRQLIRDYATGALNDATFAEGRTRILSELKGVRRDVIDKGVMYADNLLEVAREVKRALEHGERLEDLDLDLDVVVGRAKSGVRTEAQFNAVDRITEKLAKSKVGRFVNETTLASGVAIAYSLGRSISQRIATSKAAAFATFGASALVAGGVAGLKESKRLEEERRQHFREMAKGKNFSPDSAPRRKEMEEFRYETREANGLAQSLEQGLYNSRPDGTREVKTLNQGEFDTALTNLAEIETRIRLADSHKIDLISYSGTGAVEQELLRLDLARAQAKVELRQALSAGGVKTVDGKSLTEVLDSLVNVRTYQLIKGDQGIERKNELFKKLKHKRVAKAVAKGVITGLVVGGVVQEVSSFFSGEQTGVVEGLLGKDKVVAAGHTPHFTSLEAARRWIMGDTPRLSPGTLHEAILGNTHLKLPEGVDIVPNADGSFGLTRGGEMLTDHLQLNPDGSLTSQAQEALRGSGVLATATVDHIAGTTTQTTTVSVEDYVNRHQDLTHNVHRTMWYDNDTPKPVFDKNELKLWWGGEHNTGLDANGNYTFNVKHMMPDGSFHDKFSVDAQKAMASGKLKLLLSLSQDTQNHVVEIPIDASGNAIIDPNSEVGKAFFQNVGGKAKFLGKFAEVAEMMGQKEGVDQVRLLATHVGEGIKNVTDIVATPTVKDVPTILFNAPADYRVDLPPVIPLFGRTPLEKASEGKPAILEPTPIEFPPYHGPPIGYEGRAEGWKKDYADLRNYRNSDEQAKDLTVRLRNDHVLSRKYEHVMRRLDYLTMYQSNKGALPPAILEQFADEVARYNRRYETKLELDEYVAREVGRLYRQVENIMLEESNVGDRPFSAEFYDQAPLVKGLKQAEEVVIIMDDPLGDAIMTVPLVDAIDKYYSVNKLKGKQISVVCRAPLFAGLPDQYAGRVRVVPMDKADSLFKKGGPKSRFVVNASKTFSDYSIFDISDDDAKDPARVMSVDYASWLKEEVPQQPGSVAQLKKYDMLGARVLRNFEVMAGQKIYKDINAIDHVMEPEKDFASKSTALKAKYGIQPNEKIIVISAGSSVAPKEYTPERWATVISSICDKHPDAHILFLDDPDETKRVKYGSMIENLIKHNPNYAGRITRVREGLDKMNTILSMADLVAMPDTGLAHLAGALGKPTVVLAMSNPVLWSTPSTKRALHPKGIETYAKGRGSYSEAYREHSGSEYFVDDNGQRVGASDIDPAKVVELADEVLKSIESKSDTSQNLAA